MIILVGASASGKTVTALDLEARHGFSKAITTTTREKRVGEIDGVHYFFISEEEFKKRLKENKFVEYSCYNGNYYGCGIDQVADNKVVCLDPNGLHSFQKLKDKNIVSFLLVCNEEKRIERMHSRGDELDKIKERIANDRIAFSKENIGSVDFEVNTDDKNIAEVSDIINEYYLKRINK